MELLTYGIVSVELVGYVGVILPGHPLANGALHQSGQGGQHVDGWVHLEKGYHLNLGCVTAYTRTLGTHQ